MRNVGSCPEIKLRAIFGFNLVNKISVNLGRIWPQRPAGIEVTHALLFKCQIPRQQHSNYLAINGPCRSSLYLCAPLWDQWARSYYILSSRFTSQIRQFADIMWGRMLQQILHLDTLYVCKHRALPTKCEGDKNVPILPLTTLRTTHLLLEKTDM